MRYKLKKAKQGYDLFDRDDWVASFASEDEAKKELAARIEFNARWESDNGISKR